MINFMFNLFQLVGWITTGYNLKAGNNWAMAASILFSLFMGLASAMNSVGEELRKYGSTNQHK